MAYGWEGERVRLVPLDWDRHFENCLRWINDPVVTEHLIMGDFPMTRLAEKDWFENWARKTAGHEIIFAIETLEGKHIGNSGIHDIEFRHGTAMTGSLIGEVDEWGKGYGTDAAMIRSRYCFDVLGLRLLRSSYFEGNDRSARMQARAGYEVVGRWPKSIWKRGAYRDEVLTCLSRERWESLGREVSTLV